ncbi:hypothetical protein J4G57_05340 [Aeromonas caviae]|uniref:hypothetical protein n=1 Tax=Aeromonas TaxID=642 RepID=UPI000F767002|nr:MULTISPECIES: hypothetical protein [Aeromonas]MBS4707317.1 hypothetical protein [Aeromonas caviae]RSM32284.1 hypothetical protein C5B78_00960 [Aeromonas salmonicida]
MDYSKYDTYLCFYKSTPKVDVLLGVTESEELVKVHETLGRVIFAKAQEYNVQEKEVESCVIKVQWHPAIRQATHVEIKSFYINEMYSIELQQMPFNDGELELKCIKQLVIR